MSDKMLFYLFAAQLSASASSASLASSAAGILTGLLYRFNILGMRTFAVPGTASHVYTRARTQYPLSPPHPHTQSHTLLHLHPCRTRSYLEAVMTPAVSHVWLQFA